LKQSGSPSRIGGELDTQSMRWITSAAVRSKLNVAGALTGATSGPSLWQSMILERPALVTKAMTDDKILYGNFADLVIVHFGMLEIIVNPYVGASYGQPAFVCNLLADCGPVRPKSFCASTDSAAQ
jgi:hypothetical protein